MSTLLSIKTRILDIVQDDFYLDIVDRINEAINVIAGGIRMPNGSTSPPLPQLFQTNVVVTTTDAFADLPVTYQRNVFYIADSNGDKISPPSGGGYYDFMLFLKSLYRKDMTESGSVYSVCIKGKKLYYQGIPSSSKDLTIMFYRLPVDISADNDEPDGIPAFLQMPLIKNYVCKEIFNERGDKGDNIKASKHAVLFYQDMADLISFIGLDAEPEFYGKDNSETIEDLW